jgi:double-stranded uracil-DNA glycosylase
VRFTRAQLEAFHGTTVPDFLPDPLRLLFVGINPGLVTAATGTHFGRPGNRFYPALVAAGILPRVPVLDGTPADAQALLGAAGIGITNLVAFASARADELTREQLHEGAARLVELVRLVTPPVVAIVGISAYRDAFRLPKATTGEQPQPLEGARLWVVPNPSGLNAHDTVASLAVAYAEPARAAGVLPG